MPYQDRHGLEGAALDAAPAPAPVAGAAEPSNARTIQIVIIVGLVAAILVAVFGNY